MNAQEIIDYIANSEKKTPVKLYVNTGSSENSDVQMLLPLEPMTQPTGGTD